MTQSIEERIKQLATAKHGTSNVALPIVMNDLAALMREYAAEQVELCLESAMREGSVYFVQKDIEGILAELRDTSKTGE